MWPEDRNALVEMKAGSRISNKVPICAGLSKVVQVLSACGIKGTEIIYGKFCKFLQIMKSFSMCIETYQPNHCTFQGCRSQ